MVKKRQQKYSLKPANPAKSSMTMGTNLRVSFKNTCEVANTVRGMTLERANSFLRNVIKRKECVPFTKFNGGIGHTPQAKAWKKVQGRWPEKSCRYLVDLLHNCETNAHFKGLDLERMFVKYLVVQKARRIRRRIYRAHGRINPFMSTPCHIEMILEEKPLAVKKPREIKHKKLATKRRREQRLQLLRKAKGLPEGASLKTKFQETPLTKKTIIRRRAAIAKRQRTKLIKRKPGRTKKDKVEHKKAVLKASRERKAQKKQDAKMEKATGEKPAKKLYKTPKGTKSTTVLGKLVPKSKPEGISEKVWEVFQKECSDLRAKLNPTTPFARKHLRAKSIVGLHKKRAAIKAAKAAK